MFSTIIEFVLCSFCSKFEFNTLLLLSETSNDVKDEIDKMRIPVRFRFNKVIKKMGFNISLTITTRFKITSLDFTIFTMSDMSEEYFTKLLQLIPLCDALSNINFNINPRNNQISKKRTKKFTAVLGVLGQCKLLAKLDLKNNNIGPEEATNLATVLLANRLTLESPKETVLLANRLTLESPKETVLGQLAYIDLSYNNLKPEGAKSLAAVLRQCTALIHLDLLGNQIGPTGVESLVPVLEKCGFLSHLNLSYNNIGFLGAKKLAIMIVRPQCSSLTFLDLSANRIGPNGAKELAAVLVHPKCKGLTHLFLNCNSIGKRGIKSLERAILQCTTLTNFYIDDY
jgi:Ran GTPase-activating protein (RanGAP) involved in mRNA processing and transport